MKRSLIAFYTFLLLTAQSFSLWHMAELGFEDHEHQGQSCVVCVYYHQTNDDLAVIDSFWQLLTLDHAHAFARDHTGFTHRGLSAHQARASPA